MRKFVVFIFIFLLSFAKASAQTTDLSIVVEAQNLSGNSVSQVNIYEDFQYLITIINSGDTVNNATFSQNIDADIDYFTSTSQNNNGGSTLASNLNFSANTLTGSIANMPSNSSVEVVVIVRASTTPGGVATSVTVFAPNGTTDTNTSNNQSIISIDISDIPIDFTVEQTQISPTQGTPITSWADTITYEFTITNNSTIAFPLTDFSGVVSLASNFSYGRPVIQFESLTCLGGTNGNICPTIPNLTFPSFSISTAEQSVFSFNGNPIIFASGGSLTFQAVYKFLEPLCSTEFQPTAMNNLIKIIIPHENLSSNNSNTILAPLIEVGLCDLTDLCIETIQTNPLPTQTVNWNEEVTFVTTACNNGPNDALMRFFLQNASVNIDWNIVSITCNTTTGNITCNDFTLTNQGAFWQSNNFILPANSTVEVTTVVFFIDPNQCEIGNPTNSLGHVRSGTNLLSQELIDSDISNNFESDFVLLPPLPTCEPEDIVDLQITKTQINPILPLGSDDLNTIGWGEITYEIVITNPSDIDAQVIVRDYMPSTYNTLTSAALVSVDCIATTGTANCITVANTNIGVLLDGETQNGIEDEFWSILASDNFNLPAQSSVTFNVVIDWQPDCSADAIRATNAARIESVDNLADDSPANNTALVNTFFAPCVDLVVQTYPEFTQLNVGQSFNWIVDITNSNTSSNAINIDFEDILGPEFTISGTPVCTVINGNASCTTFTINGNTITGTIPNMDAASTVQISIPVIAPGYGGAFTNNAEAIPNPNDNQELTPETNISISNAQVIAPTIVKSFTPETIIVGQQSVLEFTVTNLSGNPAQNNINFTDNLPVGVVLAGPISWVQQNGCTATFNGNTGDIALTISNLVFPNGVENCTFSVPVTSNSIGTYLNDTTNFSDVNNLDASMASAILNVLADNSDVDIEVLKSVNTSQANIGDTVIFNITATNLGTTLATNVVLFESLPSGYNYISSTTSLGAYNATSFLWNIASLNSGQSETLEITAEVISANNLLNTATLQSVTEIDRDDTNNEDTAEVFVSILPTIVKNFTPDIIFVDQQSVLEFTITNFNGNPAQSDINFTDNLPIGVVLAGPISWVQQNGCTANFNGNTGDNAVSISNLVFPNGVANCTFSVPVTSNNIGTYLNDTTNFSDVNNLDTSMASATLNVLIDNSDVDIEVLKSVNTSQANIGDTVIFNITATNIGTTLATNIVLFESLPSGYNYITSTTSSGTYDSATFLWDIASLNSSQSETLEITAEVVSANNLLNTATLQSVTERDRDDTNNEASAEVFVNNCLQIPQGFSPNNDGENDVFIIPCVEDYPNNNIKIYNRYGSLIFQTKNYKNNWNGKPNQGLLYQDKVLPTGTYFYVFTINEAIRPYTGWLYLNR